MSAADRRKYRRPHIADEGRDYDDRDAEITRLRHDIERHIAIASEHATECERLRAELDSMTASRKAAAAWGELWRAYQALKQAVIDAGMASNPMRAVAANMCPFCHSMIGAPHELWCRHSALAAKGE